MMARESSARPKKLPDDFAIVNEGATSPTYPRGNVAEHRWDACRRIPVLTTMETMSEPAESIEPAPPSSSIPMSPSMPESVGVPPANEPVAMDALVVEDSQVPYAYSAAPWQAAYPLPYKSQYAFRPPQPREKVYSVPKRFGLSALMALMTALACLFGALRLFDTPPVVYLFLGIQVMMICVAQMFYNAEPRRASMIAGAILMPIFFTGAAFFVPQRDFGLAICSAIPGILFGAFAGYLVGTCVAGIFLLMDKLEPYLPGGKKARA